MKEHLNQALISAVKSRLLSDINLVDYVMETLEIGKEAAYRRLRGDVPFTFYEVVLIAKEAGLSLDDIAGKSITNEALFSFNIQRAGEPLDYLYNICNNYRDIYIYIKDDPATVMQSALNNLIVVSHAKHRTLTRFRLYRWLHTMHGNTVGKLEDFEVPRKLMDIMEDIYQLQLDIPRSIVLWDQNIFYNLLQDIRYYINLNVLSKKEVERMKEDILDILANTEELAYNGKHSNGNAVYLYLSSIHYESSYIYLEKGDFQLSVYNLYAIDYIHSQHPDMCREHKNWIEALKKYSTLITQCGERQRLEFFRKQRELVRSLTF